MAIMTDDEYHELEGGMKRVYEAQNALLQKLFGFIPEDPSAYAVTREDYHRSMKEVQEEFGLVEGDPDLVLFVLEQLSRSPRFKEEGEELLGKTTKQAPVGETTPSATN